MSVRSPENQKVRCLEETGVREIFQRDKTNEIIGKNIMNYIPLVEEHIEKLNV